MNYISACEKSAWHISVWPHDEPQNITRVAFRCRSWRHEGECRIWKGQQEFARIKEAMDTMCNWNFLTLSYPPEQYYDKQRLFKIGVVCWAKLRKRIQRRYGDFKYIQTWETTKRDVPHVHVAISSAEIWQICDMDPHSNFKDYLQVMAYECGFGYIGTLERCRSAEGMSRYFVKLAKELTGQHVKSQVPVTAPAHFRRIRASVGLLPPVAKNEEVTGILRFCPCDRWQGK